MIAHALNDSASPLSPSGGRDTTPDARGAWVCSGRRARSLSLAVVVAFSLWGVCPYQNWAHAIEEPRYVVVSEQKVFEIRDYPAYLVAEVTLQGSADDTGNEGFRILFRYITGKNQAQRKIEMTAPVSQQAAGLEIPMTAPVARRGGEGRYSLQFTMPAGWTLETLPKPEDPRVRLREIPAARYAVIRFSGLWTARNYDKNLIKLRRAAEHAKLEVVGEPVYSRYDPPFMPFFLRRNEIWLPIRRS